MKVTSNTDRLLQRPGENRSRNRFGIGWQSRLPAMGTYSDSTQWIVPPAMGTDGGGAR